MVSVRSVTDSTDWSLSSPIIRSTRGSLIPGTRTGTRDSEVCDSHTTIRRRELPQCFQLRRSSQDRLYKELHPVTWYICRVLVHCSSSVLPPPLSTLVWSRTKDTECIEEKYCMSPQSWYNSHSDTWRIGRPLYRWDIHGSPLEKYSMDI